MYFHNITIVLNVLLSFAMVVILSWNVRGIMSSTMSLSKLLDQTQCDLAVISEHKLKDNTTCINYLNSVHEDYLSFVKVDTDVKLPTYQHFVGKGGVGIMFKRSLQYSIR